MTHEQWLKERQSAVGASEVPTILGYGFESILDLWARKTGLKGEIPNVERLRWGRRLQTAIAEGYAEETGRQVHAFEEDVFLRSPSFPVLGATLDAETWINGSPDAVPLEIKNVSGFQVREWEEEIPLRVQIQLQAQMVVIGAQAGSACGLVGGNRLLWKDYDRQGKFLDTVLLPAVERFWWHVSRGIPPMADVHEWEKVTAETMVLLFPAPKENKVADLPESFEAIDRELREVRATISTLVDRRNALQAQIEAAIGTAGARYGRLPSGTVYDWAPQKRAAYTVEASETRVLRRKG